MKFDQLDTVGGLKKLNGYLTSRSYIEGFKYSDADRQTFTAIPTCPGAGEYPHAYRWYVHIAAVSGLRGNFVACGAAPAGKAASKKATKADDDDDCDLFGDDDEEEAPKKSAAETMKAKAAAAKAAKSKAKKVERSQVVFEIKPWEAETDLNKLAADIKKLEINGLVWGEEHKLVPVAFGIKKLLISCVIEDDKVLVDDITEPIEAMEDFVQSVDMATMNRL